MGGYKPCEDYKTEWTYRLVDSLEKIWTDD